MLLKSQNTNAHDIPYALPGDIKENQTRFIPMTTLFYIAPSSVCPRKFTFENIPTCQRQDTMIPKIQSI